MRKQWCSAANLSNLWRLIKQCKERKKERKRKRFIQNIHFYQLQPWLWPWFTEIYIVFLILNHFKWFTSKVIFVWHEHVGWSDFFFYWNCIFLCNQRYVQTRTKKIPRKKFIQQPHQFFSCTLVRQSCKSANIRKQNAGEKKSINPNETNVFSSFQRRFFHNRILIKGICYDNVIISSTLNQLK